MKPIILIITAFSLLFTLSTKAQSTQPFNKGSRGSATNFTGKVWVAAMVPYDSTFHCVVANVTFEPGARSNWHTHQAGQILLVTDGSGYTQEKGKPLQVLHKGDVLICKPDVEHWHGATPHSSMTHIAINPNTENGIVNWLKPVTDAEYPKQ